MAIHPLTNAAAPADTQPINIDTWASNAMSSLQITASQPQGPNISLSIPLDVSVHENEHGAYEGRRVARPRREQLRRDSMKRREALLKGKEGSRRRQRWENDRLLNNPHAQPPLPSDWEVRPTYPVHTVPYYLAPLWDAGLSAQVSAQKRQDEKRQAKRAQEPAAQISKELRQTFKKAKAAKGYLMDLEEEVRQFLVEWERNQRLQVEGDSEDDELVFVGRKGEMRDRPVTPPDACEYDDAALEKLLLEAPADDQGGKFGRWLVHNIANYYGLRTWSVTVGNPAMREAYVGIPLKKTTRRVSLGRGELPRPLWGLV